MAPSPTLRVKVLPRDLMKICMVFMGGEGENCLWMLKAC